MSRGPVACRNRPALQLLLSNTYTSFLGLLQSRGWHTTSIREANLNWYLPSPLNRVKIAQKQTEMFAVNRLCTTESYLPRLVLASHLGPVRKSIYLGRTRMNADETLPSLRKWNAMGWVFTSYSTRFCKAVFLCTCSLGNILWPIGARRQSRFAYICIYVVRPFDIAGDLKNIYV